MYNESIKKLFIKNYSDNSHTIINCERVFNATEKYESQIGIDVSSMNVQQLENILELIYGLRTSSFNTKLAILKSYLIWSNSGTENDSIIYISKISSTTIDNSSYIRSCMVSNNTHLSIVLDEILDDINLNTIDVLFRCYLWMAFMGINYELSTSVSVNDVNFDDMVINFCGKSYEMYRESIPSFKRSVSLKEFTYINSNYKIGAITRSRIDGNMLLRGTKSNLSPPYFKTELSRKLSASDTVYKRISYKRIKTSGMFYKMFMLESSGIKNWFDIICSEYDEDVYNKTSTMKDYIKWKDTFYR